MRVPTAERWRRRLLVVVPTEEPLRRGGKLVGGG